MKYSMKRIALFACLVASTMAINGSIKQRLVESAQNNLVEVDASQLVANCTLPVLLPPTLPVNCPPSQVLPPLNVSGSSNVTSGNGVITTTTGSITQVIPNTASQTLCSGNCNSCSAGNEAEVIQTVKERHFLINGDIMISESVCEKSEGTEQEISIGKSTNSKVCNTINAVSGGGSGSPPSTVPGPSSSSSSCRT